MLLQHMYYLMGQVILFILGFVVYLMAVVVGLQMYILVIKIIVWPSEELEKTQCHSNSRPL